MDVPWIQGVSCQLKMLQRPSLCLVVLSQEEMCVFVPRSATDCGALYRSLDLILPLGNERQILGVTMWWGAMSIHWGAMGEAALTIFRPVDRKIQTLHFCHEL